MRQRSGEAVPAVLRNFVGRQRPMEISSLSRASLQSMTIIIILLLFLILLCLLPGGFWRGLGYLILLGAVLWVIQEHPAFSLLAVVAGVAIAAVSSLVRAGG